MFFKTLKSGVYEIAYIIVYVTKSHTHNHIKRASLECKNFRKTI